MDGDCVSEYSLLQATTMMDVKNYFSSTNMSPVTAVRTVGTIEQQLLVYITIISCFPNAQNKLVLKSA